MKKFNTITSLELQQRQKLEPQVEVLNTRIKELDSITGGLEVERLVVLSGKTGEGKTTILQTLTRNFANQGFGCLWLSYEVGMREFIGRFGDTLPSFYVPEDLLPESIEDIEQFISDAKTNFGIQVVFIDHLHYLLNLKEQSRSNNSSLEIGNIMRNLKRISIKTKTLIFLIAHPQKMEGSEIPSSRHIRDSSFISQEADYVFMIWRGVLDQKTANDIPIYNNKAFLKIDKNRKTGKLGWFSLTFKDGYFENM